MSKGEFPPLDPQAIGPTRDALHDYAQVIGAWAEGNRRRRKHWWHISLRPSMRGLTTGVIRANMDFELELDFTSSTVAVLHEGGMASLNLCGQSALEVAQFIRLQLESAGIDDCQAPGEDTISDAPHPGYSSQVGRDLHRALSSVCGALEELRAGIREETSPIQVWPHHFDLAMVWLPGTRIEGADLKDEEHADKQMNFGFLFGDDFVAEPYFYVTAYPHPEALEHVELPPGTAWYIDGFKGAVLKYADLAEMDDPQGYLCTLWDCLIGAAREHLCDNEEKK